MSASLVDRRTLKLQDVPDPKPDSGQVLVRVKAAGVNPVDTYIRSGAYARKPNLPYTPGADAGGIVEAVGPNVKRFKVGDRVYTSSSITGVCAELALCEESRVHPLPSNGRLLKARRWAFLMGLRIEHCFSAAAAGPARRFSSMAPPAASALLACKSPVLRVSMS